MGINKPSIQFRKDEGLHFCLSGIHANVTSDWSAEWYFVSLEGATSVLVADGEVCAVIALKAAHGRPKVEIDNLDVTLELGPITFTGTSIHWLMNAAAFLFESYLEENAPAFLRALGFISNYLQVDVKGLPSVNDTACPFPPQEESYRVPNAWSTHMASGSVSHWGVDCAIWAVNQTGLFRYYLWPSYIPKNALGIKLDTDFMSVLVPGLKTHYDRNWDLVVTISPFALPTITFESGYVYLVGPINFSFNRCEPKNRKRTRWTKREFVFNFIADVHANGHMWIEHNPSRLETNVSLLGASNVRQGDSMAGPVDLHYASQLLQVLRGPGEDALNDVFSSMKESRSVGILQLIKFRINFVTIPWLRRRDNWICFITVGGSGDNLQGSQRQWSNLDDELALREVMPFDIDWKGSSILTQLNPRSQMIVKIKTH
eukprot:g10300.t1